MALGLGQHACACLLNGLSSLSLRERGERCYQTDPCNCMAYEPSEVGWHCATRSARVNILSSCYQDRSYVGLESQGRHRVGSAFLTKKRPQDPILAQDIEALLHRNHRQVVRLQ